MIKTMSKMHALAKRDQLERHIGANIPEFRVRFKDEKVPWWLKLGWNISKIFNKRIWTHVTTVVYPDVWFPSREFYDADPTHRFATLAHEYVHLQDIQIEGPLKFSFLYGFPQSLALLTPVALLGFLGFLWAPLFWFFGFLTFLFCLLPLGAPWRSHYEKRGYIMSMCCKRWSGTSMEGYAEWLSEIFSGSGYWYMVLDQNEALDEFNEIEQRVLAGEYDNEEIYQEVREIWFS